MSLPPKRISTIGFYIAFLGDIFQNAILDIQAIYI